MRWIFQSGGVVHQLGFPEFPNDPIPLPICGERIAGIVGGYLGVIDEPPCVADKATLFVVERNRETSLEGSSRRDTKAEVGDGFRAEASVQKVGVTLVESLEFEVQRLVDNNGHLARM